MSPHCWLCAIRVCVYVRHAHPCDRHQNIKPDAPTPCDGMHVLQVFCSASVTSLLQLW